MLTTAQAGHFTTFGFAVLRGFLAGRVTALRAETDAAIPGLLGVLNRVRSMIP